MSSTTARIALSALLCLAVCAPAGGEAPSTQPVVAEQKTKVIIVPMQGAVHYRLAVSELTKITRAVPVQKPEAVIFVFSGWGGDTTVAFELAEQIAGVTAVRTVAYVSGEHGGTFGAAAIPLLACNDIYVAPGHAIALRPTTATGQAVKQPTPTDLQLDLLKAWTEQNGRNWLALAQWLRPIASDRRAQPSQPLTPSAPASRPAATAAEILGARTAADLDNLRQQLGLADAWVIKWPDPVARANEKMRRAFRLADGLIKKIRTVIKQAEAIDPRSFRYELRDIFREYSIGAIVLFPEPMPPQEVVERITIAEQDQFADGGSAWRIRTDRCLTFLRKARLSCRRLVTVAARYPELNIDRQALVDTIADLEAWIARLRSQRDASSPP